MFTFSCEEKSVVPTKDLANEELQGSLASEALALLSGSSEPAATAQDQGRWQTDNAFFCLPCVLARMGGAMSFDI